MRRVYMAPILVTAGVLLFGGLAGLELVTGLTVAGKWAQAVRCHPSRSCRCCHIRRSGWTDRGKRPV